MIFIGFVETETDRAILFQDHFWGRSDWFPKSQIDVLREDDTHEVRILASAWICNAKQINEFQYRSTEEIDDAAHRT